MCCCFLYFAMSSKERPCEESESTGTWLGTSLWKSSRFPCSIARIARPSGSDLGDVTLLVARVLADFSGWSCPRRVVMALDGPDSSLDVLGSSFTGCLDFVAGLVSFAFSGRNSGFVALLAVADFFFFSGGAVSSSSYFNTFTTGFFSLRAALASTPLDDAFPDGGSDSRLLEEEFSALVVICFPEWLMA